MTTYDYPVIEEAGRPVALGKEANAVSKNLYRTHMLFLGHSVFATQLYKNRLAKRFNILKDIWLNDTLFISNASELNNHSAYREIIKLGQAVVPFIIRDLQYTNNHWFYALEFITGENPVIPEHQGQVELMKEDWIAWAKNTNVI